MGSYISGSLMRDELVQAEARIHRVIFVWPSFLSLIGLVACIFLLMNNTPSFIGIIVFVCFSGLLAYTILNFISNEMVVTNKRVIGKNGIIARNAFDINLSKVEGAQVVQGIMGRILGYGTLQIRGTGLGQNTYRHIARPLEFQKAINQAIDDYQKQK